MAKEKEKRIAFDYYTNQGFTAKAISEIVNVSEKTIGDWVEKGNWRAVREANVHSAKKHTENTKELISALTEQQIGINDEIKIAKENGDRDEIISLRKQSAALSQEVAIHKKALDKFETENKIIFSVYLEIMEDIFKNLEHYDKTIYLKTLDFQESHLSTISIKLG